MLCQFLACLVNSWSDLPIWLAWNHILAILEWIHIHSCFDCFSKYACLSVYLFVCLIVRPWLKSILSWSGLAFLQGNYNTPNYFMPELPERRAKAGIASQFASLSQSLSFATVIFTISSVFLIICPRGHLRDHHPTLHGQLWTFVQPPTHLILSTWFVNDPKVSPSHPFSSHDL